MAVRKYPSANLIPSSGGPKASLPHKLSGMAYRHAAAAVAISIMGMCFGMARTRSIQLQMPL